MNQTRPSSFLNDLAWCDLSLTATRLLTGIETKAQLSLVTLPWSRPEPRKYHTPPQQKRWPVRATNLRRKIAKSIHRASPFRDERISPKSMWAISPFFSIRFLRFPPSNDTLRLAGWGSLVIPLGSYPGERRFESGPSNQFFGAFDSNKPKSRPRLLESYKTPQPRAGRGTRIPEGGLVLLARQSAPIDPGRRASDPDRGPSKVGAKPAVIRIRGESYPKSPNTPQNAAHGRIG